MMTEDIIDLCIPVTICSYAFIYTYQAKTNMLFF